jgi:hypothetical protein
MNAYVHRVPRAIFMAVLAVLVMGLLAPAAQAINPPPIQFF